MDGWGPRSERGAVGADEWVGEEEGGGSGTYGRLDYRRRQRGARRTGPVQAGGTLAAAAAGGSGGRGSASGGVSAGCAAGQPPRLVDA